MNIELNQVSHDCDKRLMLNGIHLNVSSGETVVISGRSGCGKSLLFSIMTGVLAPDNGEVLANGQCIAAMDEQQNLDFRRVLGVVFQVPALLSNLTLQENLLLPLNLYFPDEPLPKKLTQVQKVAHEFGLEGYLNGRTDELSNGLAGLAGLARALIIEPQCLIWDAPLSDIDVKWNQYICRRLRLLKQQGITMVLFSNREHLIEEFADRRLDLSAGKLNEMTLVEERC